MLSLNPFDLAAVAVGFIGSLIMLMLLFTVTSFRSARGDPQVMLGRA